MRDVVYIMLCATGRAMGYVNLCHVPWVMLTYAGRAPRSNMGSAVVV